MSRPVRLLPVFALLFAASAARADDWPVPRGSAREPQPYRHDAKLLKDIPKSFLEDSPACILYSGTTHLIELDGTIETITHEITRLNARKGIDKLGEYRSISFNPNREKLTLNVAQVLKANGSVVPIEPRHVQLRDTGTDYQVYDDDKQLVISFPNLEPGDAYEVKWTVRGKNPEFDGQFFTRYNFGDDHYPVVRDEFHVRMPKSRTLNHAALNGKVELKTSEVDRYRHYHWRVDRKPPLSRDEDGPSKEELRRQVVVSTFPTWEAVGKWKHKLRAECWHCTDEIRKVVADVTRACPTDVDKARALTYWVRRHIRYLSHGPEGLGYTPHLPHQVLANRFGDCKDQAQLLAVMLKEIGLDVWLVTLGVLDDGQVRADVPSPWGTHAILLVKMNGKDYWIDTTVSQAAWDFLPRGDRDRLTYITQDDRIKLVRTPAYTHHDFRVEQTTHLAIAPDGSSRSKREIVLHGGSAWNKREAWLEVPPGERRRLMSVELQDANSKTRLLALRVDEKNLADFEQPVRAEFEFEIPSHFAGDTSHEGSLTDSMVWTRLLGYNLDPGRELPFQLYTPFESVHRYIVQLPAAYRCTALPEEQTVTSQWGSFELKVKADPADPRRFEVVMHTKLEKTRVEKKDFAAFQRFHDEVYKAYRVWLTLRPTQDLADAPAIEALLALLPNGEPDSARVLARLYLDNNKSDDARRVLADACEHRPFDTSLWDLRVKAAANLQQKEQLYRAMVRLFPKETKYVAALGANLVKRDQFEEAQKVLLPLTAHKTDAVRGVAHYQLARSYDQQQIPKSALRHLELAVESDAEALASAEAQQFKARVHAKLGQVQEAIDSYRQGLTLDGKADYLLYPLVKLEWQAGKKKDALDHLRQYTVAAAGDYPALAKAAELHLLLGRDDDAYELASRAREGGFQARSQRVLGMVHLHRKEYAKAAFHLERADADAEVIGCLVEARLALGDLDGARAALTEADAATKARVDTLVRRRDSLGTMGPIRAANRFVCAEEGLRKDWPRTQVAALVQQALAEAPEFGPALALRGLLALEKGQLRQALTDAERAIQLYPVDARALLVRGRVRLERGHADALADLDEAAHLSKRQDGVILHWLAAAQMDAGQCREAVETQRQAVRLRPGDHDLREQLRQLERRVREQAELTIDAMP